MKRKYMYVAAQLYCLLVHSISLAFLRFDSLSFMYPAYNWLMVRSGDISDGYKLGISVKLKDIP